MPNAGDSSRSLRGATPAPRAGSRAGGERAGGREIRRPRARAWRPGSPRRHLGIDDAGPWRAHGGLAPTVRAAAARLARAPPTAGGGHRARSASPRRRRSGRTRLRRGRRPRFGGPCRRRRGRAQVWRETRQARAARAATSGSVDGLGVARRGTSAQSQRLDGDRCRPIVCGRHAAVMRADGGFSRRHPATRHSSVAARRSMRPIGDPHRASGRLRRQVGHAHHQRQAVEAHEVVADHLARSSR